MDIKTDVAFDLMRKQLRLAFNGDNMDKIYMYHLKNVGYIMTINYDTNKKAIMRHAGISNKEYMDNGINFGGIPNEEYGIKFTNTDDAMKFKQWLDSMNILKKLKGE